MRRDAVALRSVVDDREGREAVTVQESLGKWQPGDELQGDVNFRTLRSLLKLVDEAGFERSPHQLKFHAAFERAAARVIYRDSWGTQRPAIMKKHNWKTTPGEVLISTPRRFGKTFSIAIFVACLALTMGCECVVFSPARRASRKLLERMVCPFPAPFPFLLACAAVPALPLCSPLPYPYCVPSVVCVRRSAD